jgi:hypothetical protein
MSARVRDSRRKNWFWLDNEIIDEYVPRMKDSSFKVYAYLCRRANEDGQCWPSQRRITEDLGMSRNTIKEAISELKKLKLVDFEVRYNADGSLNSMLYTLLEVAELGGSKSDGGVGQNLTGGGSKSDPKQNTENKTQENKTPSRGGADAPPKDKNWFTHFCEKAAEVGLTVTPEDREKVPGNLKYVREKQDADDREMARVIVLMIEARLRDWPMSPQEALNKVRGIRPQRLLKAVGGNNSIAVVGATDACYEMGPDDF